MSSDSSRVALPTSFRVVLDTPRRLRWLLAASLLLHLVLTPLAGVVGLFALLAPSQSRPEYEESLDSIPIELFQEQPATEPPAGPLPDLPEDDPISLIEELIPDPMTLPIQPKPAAPDASLAPSAEPPSSATPAPTHPETAKPEPKPESSGRANPGDAGAPAPESSTEQPAPSESPQAGREGDANGEERRIDGPIEAAGKAGKVVEDQAYVSITLHTARIREHEVGRRIALLLPSLPQWNDFFPDASLNPIRDFDHLVVVGPSFISSKNVIALLEYNTEPQKVRGAIDRLVKRKGEWLSGEKVPVARAHVDRAERVFIMSRPGLVVVVPPNKKAEMLSIENPSVPKAKGNEAMEAALVNPYKPLSRYGIQIPKSVSKAMVRLTPLPGGEVEVALQAHDESAEQAKKTAIEVSQAINALADLSAGVSSFLELAGLGRTVRLPRIELEARGQEIWGRQVLTAEQVNFLLAQLERQAAMWKQAAARHAPQKPAHPPADGRLRDAKKPAPKKMKLPAPPRGGVRPAP